jgi:hypothetical protein
VVRFGKPINYQYQAAFTAKIKGDYSIPVLDKLSLLSSEKELSKKRKIVSFDEWLTDSHMDVLNKKNYVIVGAPNIDTRRLLFEKESNFFFMGHADNRVSLRYRPEITSNLVNETYGSIDIPVLLVNLQLATAAFIKELASDKVEREPNSVLFQFDMKKHQEEQA